MAITTAFIFSAVIIMGRGVLRIPDRRFSERNYNHSKCMKIEFTETGLDSLIKKYHDVQGLPGFVDAILNLDPQSAEVRFLQKCPGAIKWSEDGTVLILPNYPSFNKELAVSSPHSLKQAPSGFALGAWYVHPKQLENTVFNTKECRDDFRNAARSLSGSSESEFKKSFPRGDHQERIKDIEEESGISYLASVYDLTANDLPWLKNLKKTALSYLREQYNVTSRDHVDLYFHCIIAEETTTLHLHVKVNEGIHPMERNESLKLDDIINALEHGKSVKQLDMERGPHFAPCAAEDEIEIMRGVPGITISEVENPFIINSRFIKSGYKSNARIGI